MVPPTFRNGKLPLIRRFCNVPGEILSIFLTSALLNHDLFEVALLVFKIFCISFSISVLNCCKSSIVIISIFIISSFHSDICINAHIDIFLHLNIRYTSKYTIYCFDRPKRANKYPRRILETPVAIAKGKQVGPLPNFRLLSPEKGTDCLNRLSTANSCFPQTPASFQTAPY